MATPEGKIKRWLKKMLEEEGVFYYSPQAGPYGTAGVHDIIGILCGLFFSVECKANESCKMTALQELFWNKIEAAGGKCFLVYDKNTIEEVRQWIVSTRSRRQEGNNCGVGKPASYPRHDPGSESCAREAHPIPGPTHFGNLSSIT